MIEKASIYTMNALNKSSELWHTSVNRKARPVVEGEHDKSWNDHGMPHVPPAYFFLLKYLRSSKVGNKWVMTSGRMWLDL